VLLSGVTWNWHVLNHALYGLDTGFRPRPQVAEGHVVEAATGWHIRARTDAANCSTVPALMGEHMLLCGQRKREDSMRKVFIVMVALGIAFPLQAAEHVVDWFVKNPKQRAVWLRKCQDAPRTSPQACENARKADLRSYVDESTAALDRSPSQPAPRPIPSR